MRDRSLDIAIAAGIAAFWAGLCAWAAAGSPAPDLAALWLAARVWGMGGVAEIYAHAPEEFFSADSPRWAAAAAEAGIAGARYPFVYPPIWAALAAPVAAAVPWPVFKAGGAFLLLLAIGLSPLALRRIAGSRAARTAWTAGALALLTASQPFLTALPQAQPQLLVTSLVLFALAWELRGRGPLAWHAAGAALGLAAALKLTPAIVALWWLATGRGRAVPAFLMVGVGLGLAQLALLPLEATGAYLSRLAAISALVVETPVNHALEHVLLILSGGHGAAGTTTAQPLWIGLATPAALLGGLALLLARARRAAPGAAAAAGPLAAWLWTVLCGPLAWSHHLLGAALGLMLLPALLGRRPGLAAAALAWALFAAPIWAPALGLGRGAGPGWWALPGFAGALAVVLGLALSMRPACEPDRAAERAPS